MICEQVEDSPDSVDTVARIQLKNTTIISLSKVCVRLTRLVLSNRLLFKDIYLDHHQETQDMAKLCLDAVQRSDCLLNVYIEFTSRVPFGSKVASLLRRVGSLTPRIRSFEISGDLGSYKKFFSDPAPLLRRFINHFGLPPPLIFQGDMPLLQDLTTTWTPNGLQWIATSIHITQIDITPSQLGPTLLRPLLSMLQGTHTLQSLTLHCFRFDPDMSCKRVTLPFLHDISLYSSDLQTLLEYLDLPVVQRIRFEGYSHPPDQNTPTPLFAAPHLFTNPCWIPILKREITRVNLMTDLEPIDRVFWLVLEAPGGFSIDICMRWSRGLSIGWEEYVTSSVHALAALATLSPGAHAYLHIRGIPPRPLFTPFLLLDRLGELFVDGGFTIEVLSALLQLSPRLRRLVILDPSPWPYGIGVLVSCLVRRRQNFGVDFNDSVDVAQRVVRLPLLAAAHRAPERGPRVLFDDLFND